MSYGSLFLSLLLAKAMSRYTPIITAMVGR